METQRSILVTKLELLEVEISYLTRPQRLEILVENTMRMSSSNPAQYRLSWVDVSSVE